LTWDVFVSAPLVADEEPGFPRAAHVGCETNIGSFPRRAERHSPSNVGIALSLWTTTPYVVEITGVQTFGEGQVEASIVVRSQAFCATIVQNAGKKCGITEALKAVFSNCL
jgi:hypothetical protein